MTQEPTSKKIILTLPARMIQILEKEKEKYIYNSVQELILEAIRDRYVRNQDTKGNTNRGRPKKINPEDFLKRKTIFKKGGKKLDL